MNILLSNDDGWDAPGLVALREAAARFGPVWVVAPADPQSGVSHRLTLDRPLHLVERENRVFSLDGTPADCARVGLTQLGVKFDWVLSGINHGANLGSDVYVSGTVAAAREATLHGVSAMALSQYRDGMESPFDWVHSRMLATRVLDRYLTARRADLELINVNFPDRRSDGGWDRVEIVECGLDTSPLPADYRRCEQGRLHYHGNYQNRARTAGGDIDVCFAGHLAVTSLSAGGA